MIFCWLNWGACVPKRIMVKIDWNTSKLLLFLKPMPSEWYLKRLLVTIIWFQGNSTGFSGSSARKASACNAGDPSSIPRLGSSPGEVIGYPLQYSWASLVAQPEKNLPAMWETWVRSLDWEDPLEEGMAIHSSILVWRIPWTEERDGLHSMGLHRDRHNWVTKCTAHYPQSH